MKARLFALSCFVLTIVPQESLASSLACVASVPERSERISGRAKRGFRIRAARKMGREQKGGRSGVGRGKKVTLARKPLDFEKPVRPRTGLLIGAAWLF